MVLTGITPVVTIHQGDIPLNLQLMGGWTNPNMTEYFQNFARVAYSYFGDRVSYVIQAILREYDELYNYWRTCIRSNIG